MSRYIHRTREHNKLSPKHIVPILIDAFHPNSVVDVGCGIGTFLSVFFENGITDLMGLDGDWVNRDLLSDNIDLSCFTPVDLEQRIVLNRKYDMAICLEVAEHLTENSADNLIYTLTELSDIVVFSAAIPSQGGQNHINEQWPSYWEKKFNNYGFKMYDVIRQLIWNDNDIFWWYKQNIFIMAKSGIEHKYNILSINSHSPQSLVHPELLDFKNQQIAELQKQIAELQKRIEYINSGGMNLKTYFRMLIKYSTRKLKMNGWHK